MFWALCVILVQYIEYLRTYKSHIYLESYALGNYNTWNSGFFDNRKSLLSPLGIIVFTFTALFRVTTNTIMLDPVMGSLVQHYCKQCTMYNMSL